MKIAINLLSLYAAWFAAVLSAAAGRPWSAAAASIVVIGLNVALAPRKSAEVALVVQAALIGLVVDGLLINLGFAAYASPGSLAALPPPWLVLMWMAFATALNVSLAWLKNRLLLAAACAAVGGPLSYYSGARLGAMQFSDPVWQALVAVGALWVIAFPLLLVLARRGDEATQMPRHQ